MSELEDPVSMDGVARRHANNRSISRFCFTEILPKSNLKRVVIKWALFLLNVVLLIILIVALRMSAEALSDNSSTSLNGKRSMLHSNGRELLGQMHAMLSDPYNTPKIMSIISAMPNVNTNIKYVYTGCKETISECTVNHTEVTVMPSSVSCETPMCPLTTAGFINVDIYCSIDNTVGETNPIVASLKIFGGQVKCECSVVALNNPTGNVGCKLHVRRCPDTIQLN